MHHRIHSDGKLHLTSSHLHSCNTTELCPFNDRALNRDLALLCERVNEASPRLPDGRLLSFTIRSPCCILPAQKQPRIT